MWSAKRTGTPRMAAVSHSAEIIGGNDDLLLEVLLRLPVRSLLKFKSVSKRWLSLISDAKFRLRRGLIRNPVSCLFFKWSSFKELKFTDLNRISNSNTSTKGPFQNSLIFAHGDFSGLRIIQSCNGLLLLRSGAYNLEYGSSVTCIYNPTTNKYTKLPNPPVRNDKVSVVVAHTLAFDPLKSPHYKVVCIRYFSSNNVKCYRKMEIYSSETGSWTLSSASLKMGMLNAQFDSGVFWNGSVHWISPWGDYLYFDVDEERPTPMALPSVPDGWVEVKCHRYLGESTGHLHFIHHIYKSGTKMSYLDVHEMEMDYSGWFLKFRVDLFMLSEAYPGILFQDLFLFSTLCVVRGEPEEEAESCLVLKISGKVMLYNFKATTFRELYDVESYSRSMITNESTEYFRVQIGDHVVHQYIESLAIV